MTRKVSAFVLVDDEERAATLLGGRPLIAYAVDNLAAAASVPITVIGENPARWAGFLPSGTRYVTRSELDWAAELAGAQWAIVHDPLRPLTPVETIAATIAAASDDRPVVVAAQEMSDTVKRIDANGRILGMVDRDRLRIVQAPVVCAARLLRDPAVSAAASPAASGSAVTFARLPWSLNAPVHQVPGHPRAFAIRSPGDLLWARQLLQSAVVA